MKFSFLGLGHESPALQLYGKLPVAKDYLRIGCGEGSARDLREWLDRTFGATRGADDELELAEPLRFLGQGTKDPLQGCLWPSADAGEQRKFPFTVLVERRAKSLLADLERGNLAQAEGLWRELAETRERCLAAQDGQQLLAAQRGREMELASIEEAAGAAADFDAWVAALWPEEQDGLSELFQRLQALVRDRYAGPFRLPLVRDLPLRDQVIAWTRVLRALGALAGDELPTLFFPAPQLVTSSLSASLVISARPLGDDAVVWLTTAGGDRSLGPADFSQRHDARLPSGSSPPEAAIWLCASLPQALASFRARGP